MPAQRVAVMLLPFFTPNGAGVITWIFTFSDYFAQVRGSSPHGKRRRCWLIPRPSGDGSADAAISHSASEGNRRPAHLQYASASYQLTWMTGSFSLSGT